MSDQLEAAITRLDSATAMANNGQPPEKVIGEALNAINHLAAAVQLLERRAYGPTGLREASE